jgi:murein DD-endopeptidase MepM/ murein hydrolase activator NlpD
LYSIARTYGVDVQELKRVNGIWDPSAMKQGQQLWIPGALRVLEVPVTAKPGVSGKTRVAKKPPPHRTVRKARKGALRWPVRGTLTSRFGRRRGRNHHGIDIGAPRGTPVTAAAEGVVKFSGWGPTGYGLMVIIKHPGHLTTVYAHNSKNLVRKGSRVKRGQRIALVGKTGRATGPHLHFEVRNDTHPKDPMMYLHRK